MHWGMGFWPLFPLLWIGLIVWLCFGARRWFGWRSGQPQPFDGSANLDAMEILRRRYARGEIDATTFEQMRERLERTGRPRD